VLLVFCASSARSAAKYGRRGESLFSIQDATIACAYAQLAAAALGLGSVRVGAFDESAARDALGLGPELRPVAILPIGYPGEEPLERGRRPLASSAHYVTATSQPAGGKSRERPKRRRAAPVLRVCRALVPVPSSRATPAARARRITDSTSNSGMWTFWDAIGSSWKV